MHFNGSVSMGNRPLGRGTGLLPAPVARVSPGTVFVDHPHLPALPAPPPAPSIGGGQCVAIGQMAVAGDGNRILRGVFTDALVDALQGTASMGNRPVGEGLTGRGRNAPSPVARVSR